MNWKYINIMLTQIVILQSIMPLLKEDSNDRWWCIDIKNDSKCSKYYTLVNEILVEKKRTSFQIRKYTLVFMNNNTCNFKLSYITSQL